MGVRIRHLKGMVCLCFSFSTFAQTDLGLRNVNGVVIRENGGLPPGLRVRVEHLRGGMPVSDAQLSYDGSFEFGAVSIPPGDYEIKVVTWHNKEIYTGHVSIRNNNEPIEIRLPPREGSEPASGTVSVNELRAPKKARQSLVRAALAAQSGDRESAIRHLNKAIRIYPGFEVAHLSLGARLLEAGDFGGALKEFDMVVRINADSAFGHANRGVALHALGRYGEAAVSARRALAIEPASEKTHFILGISLLADWQSKDEAISSLRIAAKSIPRARLMAAGLLAEGGLLAEALAELDTYLKSGDVEHRAMAEQWQSAWTARLARK